MLTGCGIGLGRAREGGGGKEEVLPIVILVNVWAWGWEGMGQWWTSHWLRKLGGWALEGWSWLMNLEDWSRAEQWSSCWWVLRYDGCAGSAAGVRSLRIGCERAMVKLLELWEA